MEKEKKKTPSKKVLELRKFEEKAMNSQFEKYNIVEVIKKPEKGQKGQYKIRPREENKKKEKKKI